MGRTPAWPLLLLAGCAATGSPGARAPRPNVVLVITDDQGYGDFGFQGAPHVRTPHLDAMAARSARMQTFYVNPVCAPTRAALMTGRWAQRSTAIDTYIGRAMLGPEEVTLAEVLRAGGYGTGIFGKWHLGDCFPMRPQDQGFDHALVHLGGGIGQPSDPQGGEGRYTDPVLVRNGRRVATEGYCTDLYFEEALAWMRSEVDAERPFFAYVATNAPHSPFHDVPEDLATRYRAEGLPEREAAIFAMIENIDQNVGRLFEGLEDMGVLDDTLVLFLLDNGPNGERYVAELRGRKGEVHEGGVRSPLLAHWPARLRPGAVSDRISAHVDLLPTVAEACGVALPPGLEPDGRSLLPLLEGREVAWPERALVIQSHRGDVPVPYHNALVRTQRWKLVNPSGFHREVASVEPAFELYDMEADPGERHDLAAVHPEVVSELRNLYDDWFRDVGADEPDNYIPPAIVVGAPEAPQVHLTRQDWRKPAVPGDWPTGTMGSWQLRVVQEGVYRVRLRFPRGLNVERANLRWRGRSWTGAPSYDAPEFTFEGVELERGDGAFWALLESQGRSQGAYQVILDGPTDR